MGMQLVGQQMRRGNEEEKPRNRHRLREAEYKIRAQIKRHFLVSWDMRANCAHNQTRPCPLPLLTFLLLCV